MERTRIAKVDGVKLLRRGIAVDGNLHLTPHHIIFCYTPEATEAPATNAPAPKPKETWITYPIIATCTLKVAHPSTRQASSIRLRCRDFTFYCFLLHDEKKARDVYDSIKAWTCKLGKLEKLYAFSYLPSRQEKAVNGWEAYDARQEWKRLGISEKGSDKGWRISNINVDYEFSPTYPALLPVPSSISDNTLNYAGRYRSRVRLPVLTYLHPVNNCSITRCSQPLVGLRQNRSIQDEKLLLAIFSTSHTNSQGSQTSVTPPGSQTPPSIGGETPSLTPETSFTDTEALEDELIASTGSREKEEGPHIYGAQQHNLIVDARPTVNAYAMQAVGMGSENMDNYPFATKAYLGIDNIHVMRDSLNKVIDTLKDSDTTPLGPNRGELAKSGWIKHISNMLDGVGLIARQVGIQHSHVLIHCSDGWDRTSQLSALSQLCLDPYYRTLDGFIVLVEKDWLSFGHMFAHRAGYLSSEKWFQIENERVGGETARAASGSSSGNALDNALLSAKGFFNKDNTKSRESLIDSDSEINPMDPDASPSAKRAAGTSKKAGPDKHVTKPKETSPVFHQFLDAAYQLLSQYPDRFEFNERFLRRLLYHLYSCQYGTFLYNTEKDRKYANIKERTRSVWDYFLARRPEFLNPSYDSKVDDNVRGQERLIFPNAAKTKWWFEVFGRTDAEMNGPPPPPPGTEVAPDVMLRPMALTGVETANHAVGPGVPSRIGGSGTASGASSPEANGGAIQGGLDALSKGVGVLGLGQGKRAAAKDDDDWEESGMREMRDLSAPERTTEVE